MSADSFKDALIAEIPNLRAFAASLSGSVTLADDVVQDTLLRAWSNSDKFQEGTNLRAWLFTILRNTYYSHYRKRARGAGYRRDVCRPPGGSWRPGEPSRTARFPQGFGEA